MHVSIEQTSGLERRLTIGVPAEEIDGKVTEKLQESAKTMRLAGFRPGKVPFKVVRQRFGAGVRQEVVGEVMSHTFYQAITQEDVRPAGEPSIEPIKNVPGEDLEYVATFEVYPEILLNDLTAICVERPVASVTEEDIDKTIENIRRQRSSWRQVDRAAALNDRVNIDFNGARDGEEFEGGKATGSDLVIGSRRMIPGFEDAIVGMAAGEEKIVPLKFPEDYSTENLRGAEVEFHIKINRVTEQELPELNDEFFVLFGVEEGGEEKFRQEVKDQLERELARATSAKIKNRLFAALRDLHDFAIPRALIGREIAALRRRMVSQFGGQQRFDESIFPDELFSEEAEKRVALGLLVVEITKKAELVVDADKVRARIEEMAASYEQPEQITQYYYGNEQALNSVQSEVMEDQVVEYLLSLAQINNQPVTYEEALKPDREPVSQSAPEPELESGQD